MLFRVHLFCLAISLPNLTSFAQEVERGFVPIFDGKTLDGWDGDPRFWSVEDGAITGETTPTNKTQGNTFLIWRGGTLDNFELRLDYKIIGHNSGIQYRSFEVPGKKWVLGGYQADFEAKDRFSGILYGEKFRGILADRGRVTELSRNEGGKLVNNVTGSVGDSDVIQSKIRKEDWNEYRIVANGYRLQHFINGFATSECVDNDRKMRRATGLLGLQLHAGPAMKVQFRNIRVKRMRATKRVAFIAGKRSHGYGSHEHKAGCMLLARALNESGLPVSTSVATNGWPPDSDYLKDVDTIVIYTDGGKKHPFNDHIDELNELTKRGIGVVCLHYGVETITGKQGDAFLDWTGGFFEIDWSVNPHWTANYRSLPNHPITNGVRPFSINDEWYYHMRFLPGMAGVTPILSDLPPDESLSRKDGHHSGNPHVRAAVLERKEPQHTAWARERPDGGRGFGFTGGHHHWNWGHPDFRRLVLNAIVWTAHMNVPRNGVRSRNLSLEELQENQDYEIDERRFNKARIEAMLQEWNSTRGQKVSSLR